MFSLLGATNIWYKEFLIIIISFFRSDVMNIFRWLRGASESRNARSTRKRPMPRIVLLSYGLFFAINVHGGVFSASSMYSAHSTHKGNMKFLN